MMSFKGLLSIRHDKGWYPMKKILITIIALFLLSTLYACDSYYSKTDYYFGEYQVYHQSHGGCEMLVMTKIAEDDDSIYYLTDSGCEVNNYYYIQYNHAFIDIPKAIEDELISIDDVINSKIPALMTEVK